MSRRALGVVLLALAPGLALADSHGGVGDAAAGERVFRKCKACHAVGPDAENKVGPVLNGVIDRQVAAGEFTYSKVLSDMGAAGSVWSIEELDAFLTQPRSYAKGTKMSYTGLRKEADRTNVIAYLATFDDGGS